MKKLWVALLVSGIFLGAECVDVDNSIVMGDERYVVNIVANRFIVDEKYMDIISEQAKSSAPKLKKRKRHIGFFGSLSENEIKAGVKIVFPW